MALDSLASITTAALLDIDRADLSTYANDYVRLAEAHFNRKIRHREMITSVDLTPTSNVCTIPSDYLHYIKVVEKGSIRRNLKFITTEASDELYPSRPAGVASHFTIIGNSLTAFPLSSNDIELTYRQKIPTLIDNDPNWLLTAMPNLYYRGIQLYALIGINETDTPRYRNCAQLVQIAIDELNDEAMLAEYYSAGVSIRGATP